MRAVLIDEPAARLEMIQKAFEQTAAASKSEAGGVEEIELESDRMSGLEAVRSFALASASGTGR